MSRLMEDLRSIPSTASTSQEDHSFRKLRVTLLSSEWRSTKGGLSTINRELAIQLAKHSSVEVSVYLPQCSEEDKHAAASHGVTLIEAEEMPGLEPDLWLSCLPEDHAVDCVIGHGAVLGRQVQILKRIHHCKWIQVIHTAPEELGMYKSYADAISRGEKKHQAEVKLCEKADQVVAVGPKLAEAFSGYLRACGKDQDVLNLAPGIFSEFSEAKQATEERKTFSVLVFGRGDNEDFQLKGYDIAARAIAELKDESQPYKLLFVGAPSGEEEKVKDLLLQQGIDRSQLTVRCFNESREQLARLFCEVDLAIMPSRTEGFGLAALEALSAGLPVLVSGNSGLGEAFQEVPIGSNCVVESEDPKDWANAIKAVRKKKRKLRLKEVTVLQGEYAEIYSWRDHCNRLVERMLAISQGSTADEQNLSKKATVICHDEKPPSSDKRLHKETPSEISATDPPQVIAHQIRNKDLPAKSKPFGDCQIQVDILLLTVMKEDTCEDCEFLSCLAHLNPGFCKIYHPDLGYVYLGDMGEDDLKLNVAVMKCYEGSSSTGGSIVVVINAVKVLKPKAVFCVGSCSGLNVTKVSLGDVVVLKKLVTYAFSKVTENGIEELGVKVPLKPHLSKLILGAGEGWKPPLKDPGALEVKIHRGTFLSGPEVINNHKRCNALIERFPEAVAIEQEGEGVYAAAHNLDIEWVVIKGISGYADGRKVKDSWRAFASFMAASLTAHILSDTIAFQALPHYGSASSSEGLQPVKKDKTPLPPSGIPDPKHPRLSKDEDENILPSLQNLRCDADQVRNKTILPSNLRTVAAKKGFLVSDNQASGNCLFYALSEQLKSVKGIQISHKELRNTLVQFLRENANLRDETSLFNFVSGYPSWREYLQSMAKDGTWGDHVVLFAAANYFQIAIRIISSLDREMVVHSDHAVGDTTPLVLGHIHELHYVSLQPRKDKCLFLRNKRGNEGFVMENDEIRLKRRRTIEDVKTFRSTGAGAAKTAKRSRSSRKGKRPLSSCAVPAPKQPKLLKEEGLDNSVVVELLKAEYKRRSQLRPLLWDSTIELPLENVYTRPKIISRRKLAIQMEARWMANMFHLIAPEGQKPDLVSGNDEVNVTEIFKTLEKGKDVMTLVEGSPGIGKTTFCVKLAYDSTHGKIPTECSFPKFEVVLLLKCRDIDGNITDTIREQLLPRDIEEKIVEKLLHFLKDIHNQERILIILDGLDELPEKSRYHVDELLHRRIFPFCYVLATTRQERGIEARKTFVFDIHLEIKGYTESDSIKYVRRHFETIGQSPKGERLIEEMQQNTFLNALRNNPLNLLLLCVVYEDYEGKLPTSRTELYQVIVQCLLRRYCAKRNLPVPEDDSVLEKMFEKEILALGELAWLCLLSDRYGFRETEMDEFERKYPGLVARELGLLYKEESLKRLKPQHEYCFLHKTFQEYVAAAYIAEKLVNQQFYVFEHISFVDFVSKYPQVFIFVSGMLGEKATVVFTQIGEELKKSYDWNWNEGCNEKTATFFIKSFNESGHAEQMAVTLCNIIPFPKVITSKLIYNYNASFFKVLKACRSFSNLQIPVELYADIGRERRAIDVVNYIESYPQLTIVSFRVHDLGSLMSSDVDRLCKWFSASKSLSEFTLKYRSHLCLEIYERLVQIVGGLASCRTLTKVTFALPGYAYNESVFNAFETGLTTLTSVNLVLWGSMKYTATRALQHFLSNKSLNSLSLCIVGCVLDLLVAAVSQALARQTVLKSLDLHLDGPLSSSSASFLEKGLMENSSLNYLRLRVHGELPGNWHSVVENLRLAKKSPVCCSFYPNAFNKVASNYFYPVLVRKGLNVKQHLTVNVWGEMKCEAAEALCEVLARSSITALTLNVRGNLTSEVSNSIARCLEEKKTLSSLSINIWGELTTDGGNVPSSLSKNSRVQKDVRIGPDESNNVLVTTTDNPAALTVFFTNVKDRRKQNVRLTINNDSNVTKEWTGCLGDALAENPSLTTLDLTVNSCVVDADLGEDLGNSLLQSTSLTSLSLKFNFSNMKEGWECKLGERLIKMASLTTLSLEINGEGEWNQKDSLSPTKLSNVLSAIKSLSSLSVVIHSESMCSFWDEVVGDCLIKCKSLKKLSLTLNGGKSDFYGVFSGLCKGLGTTSSLNTLCVAIFINGPTGSDFSSVLDSLDQGLLLNSSVTTLTLTVTVAADETDDLLWLTSFYHGLSGNTSITTLNVTINECGNGASHIPEVLRGSGVFGGLVNHTSVTTFNLTLSSSKEVSNDWLPVLSDTLMANTSLTTLRLKVNNHCATGESRLYDFSKLLIESRSLSLLELDVSFYGKESGCHEVLIQ